MKQYTYASLSLLVTAYILTLGSSVQAAYTDAGRTQDVVVKTDAATAAARSESLETTIIGKRDIENKAAKSVEEVIFSEPGMGAYSGRHGTGYVVHARGGAATYVAFSGRTTGFGEC